MTLPRFGRILGLQGDTLRLAGYVLSRDPDADVVPQSDEERVKIMQEGRAALVKRTGHDFGFDLAEWVRFLEDSPEFRDEFTHTYAYRKTLGWLRKAMTDPNRQQLVAMIIETQG